MSMTTRRDFLKSLTLSAFALPLDMQWDFTKSKIDEMAFPSQDDPGYWKKIRIRGVRQSTHIYNSPTEIDATLEVVRDMASRL
jgi:selenocysteine lyase/cysteine desulfurase